MIPAPDGILVLLPDSAVELAASSVAEENVLEGDESVEDDEGWPDARLRSEFRRLGGVVKSSDWAQSTTPYGDLVRAFSGAARDPAVAADVRQALDATPQLVGAITTFFAAFTTATRADWRRLPVVHRGVGARGWFIGRWLPTALVVDGPIVRFLNGTALRQLGDPGRRTLRAVRRFLQEHAVMSFRHALAHWSFEWLTREEGNFIGWTDPSGSHRELHQEKADAIHWVTFMIVEALYRQLLRPEEGADVPEERRRLPKAGSSLPAIVSVAGGGGSAPAGRRIPMSDGETTGPQPARPVIHEVFPYLIVRGGAAAIEFYVRVFGAEETFKLAEPSGKVAHAELRFGPATLMVADEYPEAGILSPQAFGGSGLRIHLHVDDVDALAERAVAAGATMVMAPADQAHGERQCRLRDPFGHEWLLGHEVEKVSREEMQRRFAAESGP